MKSDLGVAQEAIYWRGLFINRYSGIEFAIAELVSCAALHEAYTKLGLPPFGPSKKLQRLMQIIKMPGPLAKYREDIEYWLEQFAKFEEHRHFMVHAIMVPVDANHIMFKMYDHREGEYKIGELLFKLTNLEFLGKEIGKISNEFPIIVDSICKSVPFQKG